MSIRFGLKTECDRNQRCNFPQRMERKATKETLSMVPLFFFVNFLIKQEQRHSQIDSIVSQHLGATQSTDSQLN
jgi:hypothetical protein